MTDVHRSIRDVAVTGKIFTILKDLNLGIMVGNLTS